LRLTVMQNRNVEAQISRNFKTRCNFEKCSKIKSEYTETKANTTGMKPLNPADRKVKHSAWLLKI